MKTTPALLHVLSFSPALAFTPSYHRRTTTQKPQKLQTHLDAKRRTKENQEDNSWYDEIDKEATPDEVFWSEMDRQKSIAGVPPVPTTADDPFFNIGSVPSVASPPTEKPSGPGGKGPGSGPGSVNMGRPLGEEKATDKTLANYAAFMVDDNWLDEEYAEMMSLQDVDIDQQDAEIDKQFAEMDTETGADDEKRVDFSSFSMGGTNPWDVWKDESKIGAEEEDDANKERVKIMMEKCKYSKCCMIVRKDVHTPFNQLFSALTI